MNTTHKPIDPEFLHMLAGAKARGLSWTRLAELTKIPVGELEVIPWREPQEWAKASKYAEKLVAHEVLAEMVSSLRFQMNDPVNNGRLKTQVANSLVRVIQQQHALRTPKKPPVKHAPPVRPMPEQTPTANPTPLLPVLLPVVSEPVTVPPPMNIPQPARSATPFGTVAAVLLLLLVGALALWRGTPANANETAFAVAPCELHDGDKPAAVNMSGHDWAPKSPQEAQKKTQEMILTSSLAPKPRIIMIVGPPLTLRKDKSYESFVCDDAVASLTVRCNRRG